MKTVNLKTAKLFDVTALATHLLECDYYLFLDQQPVIGTFGCNPALFSLYYSDDIKENLRNNPLPEDASLSFDDEIVRQGSIYDVMEHLLTNDIIQDKDILRSWQEHIEWHMELEDQLFSASIADFVYPDCYSDNLYVYSDISVIQRFVNLLTTTTDVTFCPEAIESQTAIINEMLPFVVEDLIPTTCSCDEVSVEKITALMQQVSVYLAKLFWIHTL